MQDLSTIGFGCLLAPYLVGALLAAVLGGSRAGLWASHLATATGG